MNKQNIGLVLGLSMLVSGWVGAQDADPTRPPARVQTNIAPTLEPPGLQLTSIWYRGSDVQRDSSAVINGRRVTVGDTLGDHEVVLIEPDQVTLKSHAGEVHLKVFRSSSLTIERH